MPSCAACGSSVPASANECSSCGNNPAKTAKWSAIGIMFLGVLGMGFLFEVGVAVLLLGVAARLGIYFADYHPSKYDF